MSSDASGNINRLQAVQKWEGAGLDLKHQMGSLWYNEGGWSHLGFLFMALERSYL